MLESASAVGLVLFLTSSMGAADEKAIPPAPVCLTRDGQPLPEAKDPVWVTALTAAERPVPVSTPRPRWSRRASDCPLLGEVWVQMIITTNGDVCAASLFKPLPRSCQTLGADVLEAAQKWKFRPVLRDGAPIAVRYLLGFNLKPPG
jgi:hypothetical protein